MTDTRPTQLYRAYDDAGALLYVGISLSTLNRVAQHRDGASPWFPNMARLEVQAFASRAEAETAERAAIRSERPQHNICHNYSDNALPTDLSEPMTGPGFRAWRHRMHYTQAAAAAALGMSVSQIIDYENGSKRGTARPAPIPRVVALACLALERLPATASATISIL